MILEVNELENSLVQALRGVKKFSKIEIPFLVENSENKIQGIIKAYKITDKQIRIDIIDKRSDGASNI
jgi:hypothetical protein